MQHLDVHVAEQALAWASAGETVWLCTVLSTFGSSPREPGSMLAARANGQHVGSLSGGCVEEDFLERLQAGAFERDVSTVRYGDPDGPQGARIALPCGGILKVLVERLAPTIATREQLETLLDTLLGQRHVIRQIDMRTGTAEVLADDGLGQRVTEMPDRHQVHIRVGPAARLIIAGISPVSVACAEFARTLGFEVIVCDPREDAQAGFNVPGIDVRKVLPSSFIAEGGCHGATAIVALTHDPRIDDLAMIEAVRTPAFYIGVMGSLQTSRKRAERLRRSGGLSEADIARLHMPIGMDLGSKTPAEIALAVMADIVRVRRGR